MIQELRASLMILLFFTLVTGIAYPIGMTIIGQKFFPYQANGSLIEQDGKIIGSELIGQNFTSDRYFHPRPSAAGNGYDAANSSGSNLAMTATDFLKTVAARVADLRAHDATRQIPVDLVTASGSGLDPDISVDAAYFQAMRVALARGLPPQQVHNLITEQTTSPSFGVFGTARVNVLRLNRALDKLTSTLP